MPHIHEKMDFTTEVFIVFQGKALLRRHDKYKRWLSVGGHIELDEDPVQAAIREVKEEVGLDIEIVGTVPGIPPDPKDDFEEVIPPRFMYRNHINEKHEHVTMVYFARSKTDKVMVGGRDGVMTGSGLRRKSWMIPALIPGTMCDSMRRRRWGRDDETATDLRRAINRLPLGRETWERLRPSCQIDYAQRMRTVGLRSSADRN